MPPDNLWVLGFVAVLAVRLLAAATSPIMDCDETYNYWEPLHYVLYGSGMQTWEYAPQYALRSWAYIELHAALVRPILGLLEDKRLVFYAVRQCLAVLCATSELLFSRAVAERFGERVGALTLVFSAASSGMFHAGVALLPSTTCMYCVLLGHACWLRGRFAAGLAIGAFGVLLAWPFVAPMFVPMGLHALVATGVLPVIATALASLLGFGVLPAVVDGRYYGTHGANSVLGAVSAVGNLVLYNVAGSGGGGQGANLYGTEPASFYPKNLVLNLNLVALAAPPSVALLVLLRRGTALLHLAPMLAAFAVFQSMEHKAARSAALVRYYGAPLEVYAALPRDAARVCVGKEWYRFPSSFFLPPGAAPLRWLRSDFGGQLPQPFAPWPGGTAELRAHFNDANREEPSRYARLAECAYAVDLDLPGQKEPSLVHDGAWERVACAPFLDAARSRSVLARALYVPGLSQRANAWAPYCVMRRR